MKLQTGFNIKRNKRVMVSDIIKFFEVRGYTLIDANAQGMEFRRGSVWGCLISLNPINWKTRVKIDVIRKEKMDYDLFTRYHFSTIGQFLTSEEKKFFKEEVDAFEKAISDYQIDEEKAEELARDAAQSNFKYLIRSFPLGIVLALILLFLINISLSGSLSFHLSTGIVALSILSSYFLLTRIRRR